ncbi:acyltransferase [Saccharothrix sp. 6-C]|uniref:acyltransferase family protein n=1 Tax=Saccharothrix sp. 6-C TaxID=2781735 RepID=UPI001916F385|nr:acyltransferase [Saccharothrix sp. 6-C]QQQ76520.1 acyltransferase [Saccharothrix sp. 6-C]
MSTTEVRQPPETAAAKPDGYLHGLDLLRVIASCAVVFTHVLAWFAGDGEQWWAGTWTKWVSVGTLHLHPWLSFVGVAFFLVVSGVVVTHVTNRETPGQFLRRRVTRLAPLLFVVTFIGWCLINFGLRVSRVWEGPLGVDKLLLGMVLGNTFAEPDVALLAVTWTLRVQIVFYVLVALSIPLLRRWAWVPPLVIAALACLTLLIAPHNEFFGAHFTGFATYIPLLCLGQLISLVHSGKVHPVAGVAIGSVHFLLLVWADKLGLTFQGDGVPRTALLAVLVVVLLMKAQDRVSRSALVKAWAKRTYAIYLVHVCAIYPVFDALTPHLDENLVVLIGLAVAYLAAEALHRWVEMPADRAIRRWERRRSTTGRAGRSRSAV